MFYFEDSTVAGISFSLLLRLLLFFFFFFNPPMGHEGNTIGVIWGPQAQCITTNFLLTLLRHISILASSFKKDIAI